MSAYRPRVSRRQVLSLLGGGVGIGLLGQSCAEDRGAALRDGGQPRDGKARDDASSGGQSDATGACAPTTSDVEGPYYLAGAPSRTRIAAEEEPGERMIIRGTVYGPDCQTPLVGAVVDVWQADKDGVYHGPEAEYRLRGQMLTDANGSYELETIMPGAYALGAGFRPAHIHFTVSRPGHVSLTTQLYFAGDPYLPPNDACGTGCNSDEPDRVVAMTGDVPRRATFDIVLAKT